MKRWFWSVVVCVALVPAGVWWSWSGFLWFWGSCFLQTLRWGQNHIWIIHHNGSDTRPPSVKSTNIWTNLVSSLHIPSLLQFSHKWSSCHPLFTLTSFQTQICSSVENNIYFEESPAQFVHSEREHSFLASKQQNLTTVIHVTLRSLFWD